MVDERFRLADAKPFGKYLGRWGLIAGAVGVLGGTASAVLLESLRYATEVREAHTWIITLLPLAGLAVGYMYHRWGKQVERGNNLILEELHREVEDPRQTIPFRMTPFILVGTILTHLFGGSAGREGTAIQTGASLADQLAKPLRLGQRERRILLMAGVSAGFASVFGTPLAGAVFGMEVLAIGLVEYEALLPCFVAAFVGDLTTRGWHVTHATYVMSQVPRLSVLGLLIAALAGVIFGLVAMGFARATERVSAAFKRQFPYPPMRPFFGGFVVALAVFAAGTTKYIGLGIPTIQAAFLGRQPWYDWFAKICFTVVTLGAGFKGGEVTPLFYIGATLGNAMSWVLPLPPSSLAAMGFVAVFAGAANTPIASTLMACELFGGEIGAYAGIACVFSYLFSGHKGIYSAQRIAWRKFEGVE
jgi:H+/Cl- antiporter ClcA